jgi:hypothetical protein
MSGTGDLVGDGPGVAGHGGRVLVDLVEEQPQGAGDGAGGGWSRVTVMAVAV